MTCCKEIVEAQFDDMFFANRRFEKIEDSIQQDERIGCNLIRHFRHIEDIGLWTMGCCPSIRKSCVAKLGD
jgi:hypothetical protein